MPGIDSYGIELLKHYAESGSIFYVIHDSCDEELSKPENGGTRLIRETILFLKEQGWDVRGIRCSELPGNAGVLRKAHNSAWSHAKGVTESTLSQKRRLVKERLALNLFSILFHDLIGRMDFLAGKGSFPCPEGAKQVIIHNTPFGFVGHSRFWGAGSIHILFEQNIEHEYYQEKLGKGILSNALIWWAKEVELDAIRRAGSVFCLSKNDSERLLRIGAKKDRLGVWLPLRKMTLMTKRDSKNTGFVVGFVGTDADQNVRSVERIIDIAKDAKGIRFIIIGSVKNAFEDRKDMPGNIRFTGFVDDMGGYLSTCDVFINPKTSSHTGAEMKMLDYLAWNRPIITTESGASGYENAKGLIICDVDEMADRIRKLHDANDKKLEH